MYTALDLTPEICQGHEPIWSTIYLMMDDEIVQYLVKSDCNVSMFSQTACSMWIKGVARKQAGVLISSM